MHGHKIGSRFRYQMGQEQLQASPSLRLQGGSMPLITLSTAAWRAWMTFFGPAALPCRFPVTSNFLLAFFLSSKGLGFFGAGLAFAGGSPFFFAMPDVTFVSFLKFYIALFVQSLQDVWKSKRGGSAPMCWRANTSSLLVSKQMQSSRDSLDNGQNSRVTML